MFNKKILEFVNSSEKDCEEIFKKLEEIALFNQNKVLNAFQNANLQLADIASSTGYGAEDRAKGKLGEIYANAFGAEFGIVSPLIASGTHALTIALFGILRPDDIMFSVTGKPYDTLDEVIGIKENPSSLKSYNVNYEQIDLVNDDFDYEKILERVKLNDVKMIYIQRSKGYSTRKSISIDKLEGIIKEIRKVNNTAIIMVDNCYCEFVTTKEPIEVGADICAGSLIKNLGGGIAPNGAYVVGRKDLIELIGERLTAPGEGKEVGPSLNMNKPILQGLFMAPSVVGSALKTAILTSFMLENLGYKVEPKYNEERVDIVQNIIFGNPEDLKKYTQGIQMGSPIDSNAIPEASDMPGYDDKVIMAAGAFTQGSSIELSCDAPIRPPYIAYQQGSLTYNYGKIAVMNIINEFKEDRND